LGLARYANVIAEDITFGTFSTSLCGAFAMGLPCGESADAILVEEDSAEVYRLKDNRSA
jgi:hypothetical protein